MADVPDIRASDAERERVATELRGHAAEGRLDVDELDERLQQAYAARTRGDLDKLTAIIEASQPKVIAHLGASCSTQVSLADPLRDFGCNASFPHWR